MHMIPEELETAVAQKLQDLKPVLDRMDSARGDQWSQIYRQELLPELRNLHPQVKGTILKRLIAEENRRTDESKKRANELSKQAGGFQRPSAPASLVKARHHRRVQF